MYAPRLCNWFVLNTCGLGEGVVIAKSFIKYLGHWRWDHIISMFRNILQVQSPGIEADKGTLAIASLKLLLFIFLLSFCLTEILLLTGDSLLYGGKEQSIAWYCFISMFSLGMILDASYVLGKKIQSSVTGKRRGIAGTLLQMLVLIISPLRLLNLVTIAAALGMIGCAISLLGAIF